MIRFLAISIFSILFLSSCALKTTEGLRSIAPGKETVNNPYFSSPEMDYVYKARIEVMNRNFGGILIIKKMAPQSHRIVMTTEFGSKLLDFQYERDTFIKNYVVEDLDKKFILNILKEDFRLLLIDKAKVLEGYSSESALVYKTQYGKRFNYYFYGLDSGRLEKIVNTSQSNEKVKVFFEATNEKFAEHISIKHNKFKLKIDLEKFKDDLYVD